MVLNHLNGNLWWRSTCDCSNIDTDQVMSVLSFTCFFFIEQKVNERGLTCCKAFLVFSTFSAKCLTFEFEVCSPYAGTLSRFLKIFWQWESQILLNKLDCICISGMVKTLFESHLTCQTQTIGVSGNCRYFLVWVKASYWDPLMFIIYKCQLKTSCERFKCLRYTHNTNLFPSGSTTDLSGNFRPSNCLSLIHSLN